MTETTPAPKAVKETPNRRKRQPKKQENRTEEVKPLLIDNDTVDISSYISNLEGNVYAIANLPEEFIATLFAWVSRSPKSFKKHLSEAVSQFNLPTTVGGFEMLDEKARAFHEKWTVGYGHSSVAEHATAHIGIEKVSRLASSEIELANGFLSITEYSQRYQKPAKGEWFNPFPAGTAAHKKAEEHFEFLFTTFEELIDAIHMELDHNHFIEKGEKPTVRESFANQKLAFEDARYVLPLAMFTQLGMTANGRAWRDALATLGTSVYPESQKLAKDIKAEISKVLPALLKYAEPSAYQTKAAQVLRETYNRVSNNTSKPGARLLATTPEQTALNEILAYYIVEAEGRTLSDAINQVTMYNSDEENGAIFKKMIEDMKFFDNPPAAFKHIKYRADFAVSEANWHQLLRHNRMTDFTFGAPSVRNGIVIPPRVRATGLTVKFVDAITKTNELYESLQKEGFKEELDYLVLNAHRRIVTASFSLWEAYHLINLRTSEEAQWDIRDTFNSLHQQLMEVHPRLISMAQRRP